MCLLRSFHALASHLIPHLKIQKTVAFRADFPSRKTTFSFFVSSDELAHSSVLNENPLKLLQSTVNDTQREPVQSGQYTFLTDSKTVLTDSLISKTSHDQWLANLNLSLTR